ncbi:MAG: hypothetical protein KH216_04660, partial [Clostridiales bacterium]|nr:hypothetical protein [Clostridiales bacterium]
GLMTFVNAYGDVTDEQLNAMTDEEYAKYEAAWATKLNQANKFLKSGDKVKVSVRFRGREITHSSLGRDLLIRFRDGAEEFGVSDKDIKMEGRNMAMVLSPKKA